MDRNNHNLHIIKFFNFPAALHDRFNDLLIADTFRLLALSIISIFIPIFLLSNLHLSLVAVSLCELGTYVANIFLHYLFVILVGKVGVKKVMVASYLGNAFTCGILYFGNDLNAYFGAPLFIFILVLLNAIPTTLYWTAHHIYFLESIKAKDEGRKLGILQSVPLIISIAGPFIGSLLIACSSFKEVFLFSIALLLIASASLSFSDDINIGISLSWDKIIDSKNFKKNAVFFLQGLCYCATTYVWPIFLFYASIKLIVMGFFYLLSNFLNGAIMYFGGKKADQNGTNSIIRIGAAGHSLSIIFRALSTTMLFMATFQSMGGLFGGLMHLAIDTGFYKNSHKNMANAIVNREFYMHLGRIAALVILFASLVVFPIKAALIAVLLISGLATFLLLMVVGKNNSFMEETISDKIEFSVSQS